MKDRVLIVTPIYPPYTGGAAGYFYQVVQYIKDDADVIVLTTRHGRPSEPEKGIRIFRTIPNLLESYVPNKAVYRMLRYFLLPSTTFLSALFIFLRYRPKLVHAHSSTSVTLGACLFSFLFRVPIIIDVQDMFPKELPLKWVIKVGCSPRYIALGKSVEEMLYSIDIPKEKILTQSLAPIYSTKKIVEKPRTERDEGKVNILFVGELTKIKGIDILLESFKIASSQSESLSLRIIGGGPMRSYCKKFIGENDLNVELLGRLKHENVLGEIFLSDIVVLPSRTEGYSRVKLEAFELERPLIATRVGGLPELLKDGENGILVEPCDAEGLAEAMLKLSKDAALRERMGKRGKQSLKDLPSWEEISRQIVDFYGL